MGSLFSLVFRKWSFFTRSQSNCGDGLPHNNQVPAEYSFRLFFARIVGFRSSTGQYRVKGGDADGLKPQAQGGHGVQRTERPRLRVFRSKKESCQPIFLGEKQNETLVNNLRGHRFCLGTKS